jgi:hypothetical protein
MKLLNLFYKIFHGLTFFMLTKGHGNFYEISDSKDITGISPMETFRLNNNPTGTNCLLKCNREVQCNAVTAKGLECKMYAILRDNKCMNYTLIDSPYSTFYLKAKKRIDVKCAKSEECFTELGLKCIRQKCQCNSSQY